MGGLREKGRQGAFALEKAAGGLRDREDMMSMSLIHPKD